MARITYGYGLSGITAYKLNAPIDEEYLDPTTIEGFRVACGNVIAYDKPKNFKNTFINYNIANVNTYNSYKNVYYVNSGSTDSGLTSANDYYYCNGGNWSQKYSGKKIRFPYPTDLTQKLQDGFPIKFNFIQYDKNENGFWNSLYNAMSNIEIKDAFWAANLFAGSNVPKMNLTFNPTYGTIDGSNVIEHTSAVLDACFNGCTDLKSITLTRKGDTKTFNNLTNVFRGCSSLSALTFNSKTSEGGASNEKWNVGQLSGTFEWCSSLKTWPSNFVISNTQYDSSNANDYVAYIPYAFEGSGFQTIGSNEEFKVGAAQQAFNLCSATTINSTLDMRYIHPTESTHVLDMFGTHNIENIELKNINHNNWYFDGQTVNGFAHIGDCSSFDQSSVNYLFHNLYDLTSNALPANILRRKPTAPLFNDWTNGEGVVKESNTVVKFNANNGTLTLNDASGKFFKFTVSNMSTGNQLTVVGGANNLVISENGDYYVDITASTCTITANNVSSYITVSYITTWNGEVDTTTSASLYCPSEWDNSVNNREITDEMVTIATNRGWMVYVNNVLHTVRVEVVLDDNSLNVGETTNAKVYFVRTRGGSSTITDITSNTGVTFNSTNPNVASVDNTGEVTANGNGEAYIYVTYSGLTSSIVDNNAKETVSSTEYSTLTITPATGGTVSQSNPNFQFTATYRHFTNGTMDEEVNATSAATWGLSNNVSSYATISEGMVTYTNNPASDTTGTVSASYSGISASVNPSITVANTTVITHTIEITAPNVEVGETGQCSADYVTYTNGVETDRTTINPTAATWTTDDSTILTVDANGIITGAGNGSTNVNCTYLLTTGSASVVVSSASLVGITLTINTTPTMPASGGTITSGTTGVGYTITANYGDGSYADITNNGSVIKSGNTVTATTLGTTVTSELTPCSPLLKIEATYEGFYAYDEETIYQERNTAGTPVAISSWTNNGEIVTGSTNYTISGTNRTINVAQTGGTISNLVSGNSITYYSMPRTGMTRYETTYTSGAKTVNDTPNSLPDSSWTITNNESVNVRSYPSWVNNATTSNFTCPSNSGGNRSGNIIYELTNSTGNSWTTSISQEGYYYINIEPWNLTGVSSNGETITVRINTANQTWSLSSNPASSWVSISPTTGTGSNDSVQITISPNTGSSSRQSGNITFAGSIRNSDWIAVEQESSSPVTLESITVDANSVSDIPAGGGSVDYTDASYTVTAHYSNGTSETVSPSSVSSNTVSAGSKGTTTSNRSYVGILTITANYGGKSASATISVYQEANSITGTGISTGTTTPESHNGENTGSAYYSIEVSPQTKTVSSGAGSFDITVNGYINTPTTAFTYDTWRETSQPYSAYTSGDYRWGTTTTGSTVISGATAQTSTYVQTASTATSNTSKPAWVTSATNSAVSYEANPSTASTRSGSVVYKVNANSSVTGSCSITQAKAQVVVLESISVSVDTVPVIPASGGSVTYNTNGVSYTVTAHYSDGSSTPVSPSSVNSNTVSAGSKGTTVSSVTTAGTLTINATYNGKSASGSKAVTQEANQRVDRGTDEEIVNQGTSAWTTNGSVQYDIEVSPTQKTVSSSSGSFDIDVYASAITPYTAWTCDTWQVRSTPWSAYTSGDKNYGSPTTGSVQKGTSTVDYTGANASLTNAVLLTTGSGGGAQASSVNNTTHKSTITYTSNTGSTQRSKQFTYAVSLSTGIATSFMWYQDPASTRTVTVVPTGTMIIEHTSKPIATGDDCHFSVRASDGSGQIEYSSTDITTAANNTYTSTGSIEITGVSTAATSVELYINNMEFNRAGQLQGVQSPWTSINCTVDGSSTTPSGNVTITLSVPQGQGATTVNLNASNNVVSMVFTYN